MGCDIHIVLEQKDDQTGDWHTVIDFNQLPRDMLTMRNYVYFTFIAGVRNYDVVKPMYEPRGFPDDASAYVRMQEKQWTVDWHSKSWLTPYELRLALNAYYDIENPGKMGLRWGYRDAPHECLTDSNTEREGKKYEESPEYRFVFAFDN